MDDETKKIIEESTRVAQGAAESIGGTFNPGADVITGEALNPTEAITFNETPEVPPTPPPELPPPTPKIEPTKEEKTMSDLIAELTTGDIAGDKAAFTAQQEKEAGMEALLAVEEDYTAQYNALQAEYKNIENRMQLSAEGRGITEGGLKPLTIGEQRKLSIRANTVGALLSAAQGKVTFAQSQIDRAVEAKFGQAEAERKTKIENLALLSKDPNLTIAQKNRADATKAKLEAEEELEAKKKADTTQIMKWATKLADNPVIAQQLMKMAQEDEVDLETAFALYSENIPQEAPTGDLGQFKQFFPNVDVTTPEGQRQFLDWKAQVGAAGRKPDDPTTPTTTIFTSKEQARLKEAGVPIDVSDNITKLLLNGIELEEIRQILIKAELDPKLLDAYDKAVGIEKVRGTPGEKTSDVGFDDL